MFKQAMTYGIRLGKGGLNEKTQEQIDCKKKHALKIPCNLHRRGEILPQHWKNMVKQLTIKSKDIKPKSKSPKKKEKRPSKSKSPEEMAKEVAPLECTNIKLNKVDFGKKQATAD